MSLSCWCGFSNSNFVHDCAVCSIVARGITGWPNWEIPDEAELQKTNYYQRLSDTVRKASSIGIEYTDFTEENSINPQKTIKN